MAFVGVDGDVLDGDAAGLELLDEIALFVGVEADVGVDPKVPVRESCIEDDTIPRTDPIRLEEEVRLKGKIDRIDLIFDDDGELERLLVVDYKGKSRNDSVQTLQKKIGLNLDCQLALYTFAAQQKFFGEHNVPELNEKVQAVYHLQHRELKKMTNHFSKKQLTLTPELADTFLETLFFQRVRA